MNAAAILLLAEKGLSALEIAEVAAALETRRDPTAAERMARMRERKRNSVTRNVTANKGSNERDILTSKTPPHSIVDTIEPPIAEKPKPEVSPEHVIEAWNVMAGEAGVPKAKMTPERRKKLNTFVKRHPIDDITEAIWAVPRTPFLRGENPRGWKANIDFMLQPSSFTKIIEGTYGE